MKERHSSIPFTEWLRPIRRVQKHILLERVNQDKKWGEQNHPPEDWMVILMEEIGEVSREICTMKFGDKADRFQAELNYRKELVQCGAVINAMIECFDRHTGL